MHKAIEHLKKLKVFKKHKRRLLFIIIPLIVLAVIFWPRPQKPIETQIVKKESIEEVISATGTIFSETSVDLKFLTGGKLVYLGAKKGDMVKAGQVIGILDQRTVQKNLETELRDYSQQRNTFDETLEDNQNRTIEQALNNDMKRILQNNQYDLEKAVISVELQDLAKQQAVLTSPTDGIVTSADVTTAGINVSATTSFTVADPETMIFKIDIDEADIGKIVAGQKVKVTLDAYPEETIIMDIGDIDFASHATSVGGNAYTVQSQLPLNKETKFRVGMSGDAEITVAKSTHAMTVSLASLTDDSSVYVKKGKTFEKRKVKTGIQSDTEIEIRNGLQEGEEVALQPDEAAKLVKK
jgi:HlyD family secretion protein